MNEDKTHKMSVALGRSGQHYNEHIIVIELNEKPSLRRYLSLCVVLASRRLLMMMILEVYYAWGANGPKGSLLILHVLV